jgi:hypothetical protein
LNFKVIFALERTDKSELVDSDEHEHEHEHGESGFHDKVKDEVNQTSEMFAQKEGNIFGLYNTSWSVAADVVKKIIPVPRLFWIIIHSVYGKSGEVREVDPMTFSMLENLIIKAIEDKDLVKKPVNEKVNLSRAVEALGSDVSASLCFVYSLSRRVSSHLNERIYRAIMDDALLRTRLGVMVGSEVPHIGIGKSLLAGFAGRAGLAVQLASGTEEEAKKALSGLATGKDISKVCYEVYGCDSLQVAALSLVAGGFSKDIALGIAAYSLPAEELIPGTEQYNWLSLFSVLENLRINKLDSVPQDYWDNLGIDSDIREKIEISSQKVFRGGHKFNWILSSLSSFGEQRKD